MKFLITQLFPSSCYILVNPSVPLKQNKNFYTRLGATAQSCLRFPWVVPRVNLNKNTYWSMRVVISNNYSCLITNTSNRH